MSICDGHIKCFFFSPVWFTHSNNTCMSVCLCLDSASYEPEIEWQLFSHTDCLWFLKHHYCLHELCVTAGVVSHSQTYVLSSVSVQENRPADPIIVHNAVVCLYFIRLITVISGGAEPGMQWRCKISVGVGGMEWGLRVRRLVLLFPAVKRILKTVGEIEGRRVLVYSQPISGDSYCYNCWACWWAWKIIGLNYND